MPARIFEVPGIGKVSVYRRRGVKRLTLRMADDGVRVSTPPWAPYRSALAFVESRRDWIAEHKKPTQAFTDGLRIGKYHQLVFTAAGIEKPRSRVSQTTIEIKISSGSNPLDIANQTAAKRAVKRALIAEGEQLLPQRLRALATSHGFSYSGVSVRQLKSRWGSCSDKGFITLNCFLMQLSWRHIDYVLVHELAHTKVHAHSKEFWDLVVATLPDAKVIRKEMRNYQPTVDVE